MRQRAARAPPMRRAAMNLTMAKKIKDRSIAFMIVINRKKNKNTNHKKKEDIKHIWVGKHTGLVAESCIKEAATKGVRERVIVFLPLDVVANMLSRLSVRSLLRFRCVCKQWRSLMSDPNFIKEQRIRALARPAIMSQVFRMQKISFYGFGDDGEIKDCSFNIKFGELPVIAALSLSNSVNGLVCGYSGSRFKGDGCDYLLNPATRELVNLPISSQECPEDSSVGLAFDASTGTYKVVRLFCKKDNSECCGCEILSVGTQEWRYVRDTSCRVPWSQPVFLNGALHWLVLYRSHPNSIPPIHTILAFDVKDEKFRLMPIPKHPLANIARVVLFESGGHLCIGKHPRPFRPMHPGGPRGPTPFLIIWMLKDYRRHEWTEEHNIDMSSYVSISFQPFIIGIRGQEVLFGWCPPGGLRRGPKIYSYDLHSGILMEIYTPASTHLNLITESLVSPKKLTGNM